MIPCFIFKMCRQWGIMTLRYTWSVITERRQRFLQSNHYKHIQHDIVMVVTATASVTGTMGTQVLLVYLQNYGRYR